MCWPWSPTERARAGIFLAFQRPMAIPGVKMADFLRHAATNVRRPDRKEGEELIPMREFRKELKAKMEQLRMDPEFARRYVNDGFSGGEMKRAEILQLAMLQPKFAILDETDSGLDVDAVRLASQSIAEIGGAKMGILIITHHEQLLEHNLPTSNPRDAGRPDRRNRRPRTGRRIAQERLRPHPRSVSRSRGGRTSHGGQTCPPARRRTSYTNRISRLSNSSLGEPNMATEVMDQSAVPIGEINKYDFRTESKAIFKARKGLERRRSSARSPT